MRSVLIGLLSVGLACGTTAAAADSADGFYRGKTVRLVVGYPAGGMYGIYAKLASEHLGKQLPGKPTIINEHMPGAGGMKAANYIYNAAPRDGSYIAMLSKDVALAALLKPEAVKYDPKRLSFIGSLFPYSAVFTVWHAAGVKTWEDAKKKEVVVAATGKSAHEYIEMALLREFTGMKLKAVTGYRGASSMYLAMESGEVDARIGGWIGLKAVKPHYISEKKVNVILQTGLTRERDLPDVPTMVELAPSPEAKKLFELLSMGSPVGWALSMPPDVPKARVAAWRDAFDAMVKDPDFLAAAKKYRAGIDPRPGQEVQAAVEKTMAADPAIVAKIKQVGAP